MLAGAYGAKGGLTITLCLRGSACNYMASGVRESSCRLRSSPEVWLMNWNADHVHPSTGSSAHAWQPADQRQLGGCSSVLHPHHQGTCSGGIAVCNAPCAVHHASFPRRSQLADMTCRNRGSCNGLVAKDVAHAWETSLLTWHALLPQRQQQQQPRS